MRDATTGVAQANASASTIPKLSRPSDGATRAFEVAQLSDELGLGKRPESVDSVALGAKPGDTAPSICDLDSDKA
jgi:hypothetical protein